jgi:hypothetical protein
MVVSCTHASSYAFLVLSPLSGYVQQCVEVLGEGSFRSVFTRNVMSTTRHSLFLQRRALGRNRLSISAYFHFRRASRRECSSSDDASPLERLDGV